MKRGHALPLAALIASIALGGAAISMTAAGPAVAAGKVTVKPRDRRARKNINDLESQSRDRRTEERQRELLIRKRIEEARERWRAEKRKRDAGPGWSDRRAMRRALAKFYARLRAYQADPKRRRLTILQLGDSHTAGDHFSGYMRERFQRRFGDAGRGMLAAGRPYRYYRPYQTHVAQTLGWNVESSRSRAATRTLMGISGYALRGVDPEDRVILEPKGLKSFGFVEVEFVTDPQGGAFNVIVDGKKVSTVSTKSKRRVPKRIMFDVRDGSRKLRISPEGDGEVDLISVSLYKRRRGGVNYVSHGIGGETINIIDRWSARIVRWQMDHLDPALVIVAYGTNEGFNYLLKPKEYERDFRDRLRTLMRAAPKASFVILGAPDAATLPHWCGRTRAQRDRRECGKLKTDHADNYRGLLSRRSDALCYWHEPPALEKVRDIQRRVASSLGAYYWDWSRVMGRCGLDRWSRETPPLAFTDRVHMTTRGYDVSAQAFFEAIMSQYSR